MSLRVSPLRDPGRGGFRELLKAIKITLNPPPLWPCGYQSAEGRRHKNATQSRIKLHSMVPLNPPLPVRGRVKPKNATRSRNCWISCIPHRSSVPCGRPTPSMRCRAALVVTGLRVFLTALYLTVISGDLFEDIYPVCRCQHQPALDRVHVHGLGEEETLAEPAAVMDQLGSFVRRAHPLDE